LGRVGSRNEPHIRPETTTSLSSTSARRVATSTARSFDSSLQQRYNTLQPVLQRYKHTARSFDSSLQPVLQR
jgi:hypothetical protein